MHETMCNTHTRYRMWHLSIVDAPSRALAYNIAKMQSSKIDVALLLVYTFFGMEVWNGIWKKFLIWNEIWNGRLFVWNGREASHAEVMQASAMKRNGTSLS